MSSVILFFSPSAADQELHHWGRIGARAINSMRLRYGTAPAASLLLNLEICQIRRCSLRKNLRINAFNRLQVQKFNELTFIVTKLNVR
jgi:hypothetical protein